VIRLPWPFARATFGNAAPESEETPEASVLRFLVLGCTAVGLLLGALALAGDRLGLWQPVEVPRARVAGVDHVIGARPTGAAETSSRELPAYEDPARPPPGPPLPARAAFLIAALAAFLGLLGSVAPRLARSLGDLQRPRSARLRLGQPRFLRAQAVRGQMRGFRLREYAGPIGPASARSVLRKTLSDLPRCAQTITVAAKTKARPRLVFPRGVVGSDFRGGDWGPGGPAIYLLAVVLGLAIGWLVVHGVGATSSGR
jgi:hypothetical protein